MKITVSTKKPLTQKIKKKLRRISYERSRLSLIHSYLRSLGTRNAVFIWIPKSAGTSILNALNVYGLSKLKKIRFLKYYFPQKGMVTFGHINYPQLIKNGYVSRKFDRTAYKFCFARNPYDRAISLFFYLKKNRIKTDISFLDFCRKLERDGCEDIGLYNYNGWSQCNPQVRWIENMKMDFIGKFESLEKDFQILLKNLKLPPIDLPHHNITPHDHFSSYYCEESRQIIQDFYQEDFQSLGYDMHTL